MDENKVVSADKLQGHIYTIRGVQVMCDSDLAELYGVEIKRLNEQVKRNRERFPEEFMFQLTDGEFAFLRSQNATLETGKGRHRKYLPYVFTEQGVAMLSAVLRSKTAVKISIQIIKAFVTMRKFITTNAQIFHRLDAVEQKQLEHKAETDEKFDRIFNAIESKEITPKQGVFFDG
jgi:phage regulator Rha-like protein